MNAVDDDMVLVAEGGDRQIDPLGPVLRRFGFEYLTVQCASRSFWRSLAGLRFQSSGMRPALISFFSASVLRCFGAATIVASMSRPPMARTPAFVSAASKRLNRTSMAIFSATPSGDVVQTLAGRYPSDCSQS